MLFKSCTSPGIVKRLRLALWPRRGWSRSARYNYLRLKRLPSTPHRIAVGVAIGVFAVFTPFIGFQLLLAAILCILLRGSIVASFLASFVGNPLTYPMIWFSTYHIGNLLLGTSSGQLKGFQKNAAAIWESLITFSPNAFVEAVASIWPIFKPMLLGSLPLGATAGLLAYAASRKLIGAARENKTRRTRLPATIHIAS
ncbi:MAG TPA: DUF2062 domain-containing protein [Hyphomicrobiales bacterium]|nr:DUF2062 domain-containing protein [Hyphomicrobiales bacterium]